MIRTAGSRSTAALRRHSAMELTRKAVEDRIAELNAQKDQYINNANACAGAIQDCSYWLHMIDEAEKAKGPKLVEAK